MWLSHHGGLEVGEWTELLTLADGSQSACKATLGPKGISQAKIKKDDKGKSFDLLPMYWFVERWCKISWEDGMKVVTKNRVLQVACWEGMP